MQIIERLLWVVLVGGIMTCLLSETTLKAAPAPEPTCGHKCRNWIIFGNCQAGLGICWVYTLNTCTLCPGGVDTSNCVGTNGDVCGTPTEDCLIGLGESSGWCPCIDANSPDGGPYDWVEVYGCGNWGALQPATRRQCVTFDPVDRPISED